MQRELLGCQVSTSAVSTLLLAMALLASSILCFRTWDGIYFDAQVHCCSVMIQTEILDLHICTELMAGWSGIAMAALGIGGQILEIQMADQLLGGTTFPTASPPATVGGFPFSVSGVAGSLEFKVDIGAGQYVKIMQSYASTLAIEVAGHGSIFGDAEGLCGNWASGGMVGRDGVTTFTPATGNDYGTFLPC